MKNSSVTLWAAFSICISTLLLGGCDDATDRPDDSSIKTAIEEIQIDDSQSAIIAATKYAKLQPGKSEEITLTFIDRATGKNMGPDDFKTAHTRKVHLLIIDRNLEDYHHIHPEYDAAAQVWKFGFAPAHNRPYRIWADIVTANGIQQYVRSGVGASGPPAPPIETGTILSVERSGLKFDLSFMGPLTARENAMAHISITDAATGKPFRELEPVMGAFGHIVAFAGNWDRIVHVHPMGAEPDDDSARGGPELKFHVNPAQRGALKIFVQVQKDGKQVFAPFTVTAK